MPFTLFNGRTLLLTLLLILGSTAFVLRPTWEIGGDGFGYYAYARSVLFDGDLDFENEYGMFDARYGHQTLHYWRTPLGKAGNPFAVGASLLWSPFILVAYFWQNFFYAPHSFLLTGYHIPYQLAVGIGTWTYALIGLLLLFNALKKIFTARTSWLAVLTTFLISPLPYYLIYEPSMAHGLTVFTMGLLFFLTIHFAYSKVRANGRSPLHWIMLGFSFGLAFLVRWQDVLYGIVPLTILFFRDSTIRPETPPTPPLIKGRTTHYPLLTKEGLGEVLGGTRLTRLYIPLLLTILTFLITISPQLFTWHHLYGSWIAVPQGSIFFNLTAPHFFEFLFSGYHGMFIVHPLLLLGLVGLFCAFKKHRLLTSVLFISFLLQLYLNAGLSDWFAGGSFGARRTISALFIIAFGFAALFSKMFDESFLFSPPKKGETKRGCRQLTASIVSLLIILGSLFNFSLMATYARGIIPLNQPTSRADVYRGAWSFTIDALTK